MDDSIPARLITHQPGSRPSRGPSAARSWCPRSGSEAWWRPPPGTTSSRCWLPIPAAPGRWLQRRCSAMSGPSCRTRSLPRRRGGHERSGEGASGSWWLKISVVWNKKKKYPWGGSRRGIYRGVTERHTKVAGLSCKINVTFFFLDFCNLSWHSWNVVHPSWQLTKFSTFP